LVLELFPLAVEDALERRVDVEAIGEGHQVVGDLAECGFVDAGIDRLMRVRVVQCGPLARLGGLDGGDRFFAPSRLVITDIRGGYEVTNLTPGSVRIMFNVRNSTATNRDDVEERVKDALEKAGVINGDYELILTQGSLPFMTKEEGHGKALQEKLAAAVQEVTGIVPNKSTSGGTSDARYIAAMGVSVVEFGVKNDRIHSPDECVPVEDVRKLERVFTRFLEGFDV